MKGEEFFEVLSDIDENMIAEAKQSEKAVAPVIVTPGKTRIRPFCTAAACIVLAAAVTAAALNIDRLPKITLTPREPDADENNVNYSTTAEVQNESRYPDNAYLVYPYDDDYADVPIQYQCDLYPQVLNESKYKSYDELAADSSLIVMGTFTDDTYQSVDGTERPDFLKAMLAGYFNKYISFNTLKVEKVLKTNSKVYEGDEIVIAQSYVKAEGGLYSFSQLTPMIKGDRWVFFLNQYSDSYPEETYGTGAYYTVNDYEGRYPVPGDENEPFVYKENTKGVAAPAKFNESVYSELEEKLKEEGVGKRPSIEIESKKLIGIAEELGFKDAAYPAVKVKFTMGEFEHLSFFIEDGVLYAARSDQAEREKQGILGGTGFYLNFAQTYLCDLNGDGKREICMQMSLGSGIVNELIMVFDIANNMSYTLNDRGYCDYTLSENDGKLMVCKWEFDMYYHGDGECEPLSVKELTLDMMDCYINAIDPELVSDGERVRIMKMDCDDGKYKDKNVIRVPNFNSDYSSDINNIFFTVDGETFMVTYYKNHDSADYASNNDNIAIREKFQGDYRHFLYGDNNISDIYLCDLNGDGKRELCCVTFSNVMDMGEDSLPTYAIKIFDHANEKYYTLSGSNGKFDNTLRVNEDRLFVHDTEGKRYELKLDMPEEVQLDNDNRF